MVTTKQLRELKHYIKTLEEWELLEEITPITLQPEQKKVWKDSIDGKVREQVILAHRGYGKSFLEGCHRMIKMITTPNWQSYTVYPKREQAMYSLSYTKSLIQSSPYTDWMVKRAINWGETKIMLQNHSFSFVISPSQRTATGYHVDWGYIGEAARWADDWDDIYKSAINPMTNRKEGVEWLTSSAFGERGFFFHHFKGGNSPTRRIYKFDVDSTDVYNEDQKIQFEDELGPLLYRQEYKCEFIGSAETFIPQYLINKQSKTLPQYQLNEILDGSVKIDYLGIDPGQAYDLCGLVAIQRQKTGEHNIIYYDEIKLDQYEHLPPMIKTIQDKNPGIKIAMDSTGNLISLEAWFRSIGIRVEGKDFAHGGKQEMYQALSDCLRKNKFYLPSNNNLCMEQLRYIPFKLRGNSIQFPDDTLGHHALHALVTIAPFFSNISGGFILRGFK